MMVYFKLAGIAYIALALSLAMDMSLLEQILFQVGATLLLFPNKLNKEK